MSELRKFGFIFSGYYVAVVALFLWHHHPIALWAWGILVVALISTVVFPTALTPIKWLWDGILKILNYINTRLLFGILFFIIFTPISLLRKIAHKDTMGLRYDPQLTTYRIDCRDMQNDLRRPY